MPLPLLVIARNQRERGNLNVSTVYEIASVVLLPRNDIGKQHQRGEGKRETCNLQLSIPIIIILNMQSTMEEIPNNRSCGLTW